MSADNTTAPAAVDDTEELYYRFVSNDNIVFIVSKTAIGQSETLTTLVAAMDKYTQKELDEKPIPLQGFDAATLKLVFEWCEEHKGDPIPVDDDTVRRDIVIPEYDERLMDIDDEAMFSLTCAANYFNIIQLLNRCCKKIALMAKGKTVEEIRVIYEIPTDEQDAAAEKAAETAKMALEEAAKKTAKGKRGAKKATKKGAK